MFDGVSLDQLRTFIAAADEGSFSAAGRRLRRAQSVVSQSLANLEGQLGVKLFDRGARFPTLTDQGRALLADARAVAGNVDLFKARAKRLAGGLEPELSVAVDVIFPLAPFTAAVAAFQKEFPSTLLRFDVESSAVIEPVLDGRCAVGVMASSQVAPPQLTRGRSRRPRSFHPSTHWQPTAARFRWPSSPSTSNSCTPILRICREPVDSGCCHRECGVSPISGPSMPSCARDLDLE
jgi:DNA-binding transcriptional LysR family regulator